MTTPELRCTVCGTVLLESGDGPRTGEEIAVATATHYSACHGGVSVPTQRQTDPARTTA